MGTASTDVIARLTLNAERFSSENTRVFSEMEQRARDTAARTKTAFDASFTEIQNIARRALTLPKTATGGLNLDVGQARAAAAAAQNEAVALREIATAARRAADATGDMSTETRIYVQAAQAAAREAEEMALKLNLEAVSLDRLQGELNQTTTATQRLTVQQDRLDRSARNNQLAMRNLGFQVSDVGASLASGSNLFVIFGQQVGQVGGALSDMTGKAGAVGRFLTNPWVAAVTTAGIVIGLFATKLKETGDALDEVKFASDGLGQAQGILGSVMDLTTGKIRQQATELVALAIAQTKVAAIQAKVKAEQARTEIEALRSPTNEFSGGLGGGFSISRRPAGARGAIAAEVLAGTLDTKTAVDRLDNLRKAGALTDVAFAEAAASVTALGVQLRNLKEFEGAERLLKGVGTAADRSLLLKPGKPKSGNGNKVAALAEYGRDARDRIADIQGQFADAPSRVRQAEKALRDLDDIIDDLSRKKPLNFESAIADAEKAKVVIKDSLQRPYNDLIQSAREREQIDALILNGQFAQADALQTVLGLERQMGPLSAEQLATVQKIALAEEARARAIDDQRRKVGLYVQAVGDVQRSFEQLLTDGSVKDFGKNLLGSFKGLQTRLLSESIFGGLDRELEDFVSGRTGVKAAGEFLADQTGTAAERLAELSDAFVAARSVFSGNAVGQGPVVAGRLDSIFDDSFMADLQAEIADLNGSLGDYSGDIVVSGQKQNRAANDNTRAVIGATDAFNFIGGRLAERLKGLGIELPKEFGSQLGSLLQGASLGQLSGSVAGSITGGKQSQTGAAIGGAIGSAVAGPIGAVVGGILGSNLGGLFKKTKKASSTLTLSNGEVLAGAGTGNSASYRANATTLGGSVSDQLNSIAEALGGDLTGSLGVSIGQRKKKFVVDTTGKGRTKGGGVLSFESEQEAVIAAVRDALSDGVLTGISQAAQNILRSGQDLEKALSKATLIESIPKLLKQRLDPVGAAVDEVNDRFKGIISALKEGGASAEQMAEAQKLYNLELADAKTNAGQASESLKDFLSSLKAGPGSPYSLRDQRNSAQAVLDPFLGQINRGETIDQEKYLAAAQTFLDIERQLYGSTSQYFASLDKIQAATGSAITAIDNATPIRTAADPFIEATANSTAALANMTEQSNSLLAGILETLTQQGLGGGSGAFIGTDRLYVNVR